MNTIKVVQDRYGWTVHIGPSTSPFRTRAQALREAERLSDGLRRYGERSVVVIQGGKEPEPPLLARRLAALPNIERRP